MSIHFTTRQMYKQPETCTVVIFVNRRARESAIERSKYIFACTVVNDFDHRAHFSEAIDRADT